MYAKKMRVAGITVASLCVAGVAVAGGMAIAAPSASSSQAPHVQAGALVNADGSVAHSKNVGNVTTAAPHVYCVEIANEDVDLSRAIVAVTPRDNVGSTLRAIAGGCANGKGVTVATYSHAGAGQAAGFYLAVL
ncbi:hypothetical protein [Streptomyces chryseus]|uniref:hypothetical protein n=1 Tax=Streptomyces chryseus TaxID=68186 RepID=UPI00110FBD8F|nr:hypothetical protein [Streptomyces chryseus]GGX41026.1 hypothetical protein GCM10010353_65520 [Streptomyces chryseus]